MNELTKKLLLALGTSQETIDALTVENPTVNVDDVSKVIKENQIRLIKNDPQFIQDIQSAERGKNMDIFERSLKKTFGLSAEDTKDKKIEELVVVAKEKVSVGADKTLNDLQRENVELKGKVNEYEATIIPKIKGEVEAHKKQFNINNTLTKKLAEMKLRNPVDVVIAAIEREFGANYTVDLDEKGNITIKDKATGLEVKNAAGDKILTTDDIINDVLTKNKFLEESGADNSGKNISAKPNVPEKKDDADVKEKAFAPGMSKAEAKLKELQDAKKA